MKVGLIKTSLVNFPGRVCAAVFLPGCNLRCPYCHNSELANASVVTGPKQNTDNSNYVENEYVDIEEVYKHLEKRAKVLGGLAITGGEPLLSPALEDLIVYAKSLNLEVKIDTNGTLPDRLKFLLETPKLRPNMIAIDIKTSPNKYSLFTIEEKSGQSQGMELKKSLSILEKDQVNKKAPKLKIEYRTVLVPGIVDEEDLKTIASLLPKNANWQLGQFVPENCLDPNYNELDPYPPTKIEKLVELAQSLIPSASYR